MRGCIRYTVTNSSVRENGTPEWSGRVRGMPWTACGSSNRRPSRVSHWSGAPRQLTDIAVSRVFVPRIAGVHSTVWLFAISAETTSRAFWNASSSSRPGYSS